jgi:hypothetical protein
MLLRSPKIAQLLQHTPPYRSVSAQQQRVMTQLSSALLARLPKEEHEITAWQLAPVVLKHQAAHSIGILLTWVQQQPEQLAAAMQRGERQAQALTRIWLESQQALIRLCLISMGTSPLACSQQLESSGESGLLLVG